MVGDAKADATAASAAAASAAAAFAAAPTVVSKRVERTDVSIFYFFL